MSLAGFTYWFGREHHLHGPIQHGVTEQSIIGKTMFPEREKSYLES